MVQLCRHQKLLENLGSNRLCGFISPLGWEPTYGNNVLKSCSKTRVVVLYRGLYYPSFIGIKLIKPL